MGLKKYSNYLFMGSFVRLGLFGLFLVSLSGCGNDVIKRYTLLTDGVVQYEKAEFEIVVGETFANPYDQREVALNMILTSPSGNSVFLPCFFDREISDGSVWIARFAPREAGKYQYHFQLLRKGADEALSMTGTLVADRSEQDGFLHIHDFWTLRFDSGKPFRGIGENVGWEPRSFSDPKWNYDYLLPKLAHNGANFFRSWMAPNNFPLEWKTVRNTNRYSNTDAYFNPGGVQRLDEIVTMADSLGLYMMLAFDSHNTLIEGNQWEIHNYNVANGGPARNPEAFFTSAESREKYKNRLRYIVARWGYSTSIGAWEFFNEIDNAAFTRQDSTIIPHDAITSWHKEMAAYLKEIDPYDHIVTTSVSHREIDGLYALKELDLNQMHIYKRTGRIPSGIRRYVNEYDKPFSWGEFGYEWDWNKDFEVIGDEMDFDYKRGLWYGLFSPTPILPMSWWWEFFDARGMTSYFRNVREINDRMLKAGNGDFEEVAVTSAGCEAFAVKCGETYFVYLLNNSAVGMVSKPKLDANLPSAYALEYFTPADGQYRPAERDPEITDNGIVLPLMKLSPREEVVVILAPAGLELSPQKR